MRFKSWQVLRLNSSFEARALREATAWRGGLERAAGIGEGGRSVRKASAKREASQELATCPRLFLDWWSVGAVPGSQQLNPKCPWFRGIPICNRRLPR